MYGRVLGKVRIRVQDAWKSFWTRQVGNSCVHWTRLQNIRRVLKSNSTIDLEHLLLFKMNIFQQHIEIYLFNTSKTLIF